MLNKYLYRESDRRENILQKIKRNEWQHQNRGLQSRS